MSEQPSSFSIVNALSLLIVLGFMGLMPLWMFFPPLGVPDGVLAIINQMMGAWGMAFATVVAFHLGSSKGAKEAQQMQRETVATLSSTVASTASTAATTANTAATTANTAASVAANAAGQAPPVPPATNGADEIKTWNEAVAANTKAAFEAYLAKYPNGVRAPDAKARIAQLP